MKRNIIILILLILVAIAQIFVPAKMLYDSEENIRTGIIYKFRTIPVDPNDPFRGKYITLRYNSNRFKTGNFEDWYRYQEVFVKFKTGKNGFAKIASVSSTKPDSYFYLKAQIRRVIKKDSTELVIKYPFTKYFMEETKAPKAEKLYNEMQRDSANVTYSVVSIKKGRAVIIDVKINDVSIKDIVTDDLINKETSVE